LLALVSIGAVAGLAGQADAATLYGLTTDGLRILRFDSATPQTIDRGVAITGLGAGERIAGIDVRPATGQLYGLGIVTGGTDTARLYRINPRTGAATAVGAAFATDLTAAAYGVDFNPTVDRVRAVNDAGDNLRVNPNTGVRADSPTPDTDLSIPTVAAVAYDRSTAGATVTTLFGIDSTTDQLVRIGGVDGSPSPNLGAVTNIGPLGVNALGDAGFDIDPAGNVFAALTVGGQTGLYTVSLATGAATLVGAIGDGTTTLAGLAAASDVAVVISPATGSYATTQGFDLELFVDAPGRTITGGSITFDGVDVTGPLGGCLVPGTQVTSGGLALRCPGLSGAILGAGTHTLAATLTFSGGGTSGSSATSSVTYTIIATTEP
jgi:hypothetical protein